MSPARRTSFFTLGTLIGNGSVVLLMLAWHVVSTINPSGAVPGPLDVAKALLLLAQNPGFLIDLFASCFRVVASLVAAMAIGLLLALLPFWAPPLQATVHDTIKPFLASFPAVGWALLAAIWFGVSDLTVIFVQTAILIPFCLINLSEGVRVLDREFLELGRSLTTRSHRVLLTIILPSLMPYAVSALRSAYGVAWKIALVAELFGARSGIGFAMLRAETLSDHVGVATIAIVIVILGISGDRWIIEPLNRRTRGIAAISSS